MPSRIVCGAVGGRWRVTVRSRPSALFSTLGFPALPTRASASMRRLWYSTSTVGSGRRSLLQGCSGWREQAGGKGARQAGRCERQQPWRGASVIECERSSIANFSHHCQKWEPQRLARVPEQWEPL